MQLTTEQQKAVRSQGNTLLDACPGSGKTRAIVAKVLRCVDDVRDTPRKIAVITYTNAAVYEIESRLRIYGTTADLDTYEVSTIHAFCLNNILRAFYWRCPDYAHGFSLLPSETDQYRSIVHDICSQFHLDQAAREQFPLLNRNAAGEPILTASAAITVEAATAFWEALRVAHAVDFPTIIYLTNRLLTDFPSLARALSCRFRWLLLDEFQDTTELQIEVLKKIHAANETTFFLVGDPHQSIFGFAGARPALNHEFADHIGARRDFQLSQNWRSNPQIVAHAERLRPRGVSMRSAGEIAADQNDPIYTHSASAFSGIAEHFLPNIRRLGIPLGSAAILAPSWFTLIPVGQQLRAAGVPIIGPGARPYRGSLLFARLAEYACEYIERRNPVLIRNLQRELNFILSEATDGTHPSVFSHSGRATIFRLLHIGAALRDTNPDAETWLTAAARQFSEQLIRDGFLPNSANTLLSQSAAAICEQMRSRGVNPAELTISDLGLFAATGRSLRLLTMHAAKGLEWDAVALIGLHDGQIPNFRATTSEEIDEHCRLFYVGITRAKRLLVYVTDQGNWRNRPSRFLGQSGLGLV